MIAKREEMQRAAHYLGQAADRLRHAARDLEGLNAHAEDENEPFGAERAYEAAEAVRFWIHEYRSARSRAF